MMGKEKHKLRNTVLIVIFFIIISVWGLNIAKNELKKAQKENELTEKNHDLLVARIVEAKVNYDFIYDDVKIFDAICYNVTGDVIKQDICLLARDIQDNNGTIRIYACLPDHQGCLQVR